MIERQERTALLILLVVLLSCGIFAWICEDLGKSPFAHNYTTDSPEGTLVSHQGIVLKATPTTSGGNTILDVEGVQVFIPGSAAGKVEVTAGDKVLLFGIVQIWKGKREILVKDPEDLTILS